MNILKEINEEINKRFKKEDIEFYKNKVSELEDTLRTKLDKDINLFEYCFYLMSKEIKNISKEDIGLLYFALSQ